MSTNNRHPVSLFRERVRAAVAKIPAGHVATYAQVAEIAGYPSAARAVGNAIHDNTDPVKVPCHRVVDSKGNPGNNYGMGGPSVQLERLRLEGVRFIGKDRVDLAASGISIEKHPLKPLLPANARLLFLGSFPPPRERWSMDFFYPNFNNDFWRILGLVFFGDPTHFEIPLQKRFDREKIEAFCEQKGFAFFDTAGKVCRLKANASDDFLEILEPSDIPGLLGRMPLCHTIITTGGKASEGLASILRNLTGQETAVPAVGSRTTAVIKVNGRPLDVEWHRVPSSSRAYPMKLARKAEYYRLAFFANSNSSSGR